MKLLATFTRWLTPAEEDPHDVLVSLLLAAQSDEMFRQQVLFVLRAPALQRASLVNTAVREMALRGEPAPVREAFALLASDEVARTALQALEPEPA